MNRFKDNAGNIALAIIWFGIVFVGTVGLLAIGRATAPQAAPAVPTLTHTTSTIPSLPECEYEDSEDCIWDATTAGNQEGTSFIRYQGKTYYAEPVGSAGDLSSGE